MSRFVWVGPSRQASAAGGAARRALLALSRAGLLHGAVDPLPPASTVAVDREISPAFDGPVLTRGRQVVYQGTIDEAHALHDAFPAKAASERIAFVTAPASISRHDVDALGLFDRIWVLSTFDRERLAAAGFPRARIQRIPAIAAGAPAARPSARPGSPSTGFTVLCVIEDADPKVARLAIETFNAAFRRESGARLVLALRDAGVLSGFKTELVKNLANTIDFFDEGRAPVTFVAWPVVGALEQLPQAPDLVLCLGTGSEWNPVVLEAMTLGLPVLVADHPACLDLMPPGAPNLVATESPALRTALVRAAREPAFCASLAAAGSSLAATHGAESFLAAVNGQTPAPSEATLTRVLRALGMNTPEGLIAGARGTIELCVFRPGDDAWRTSLAEFVARHDARDDATLCLWVDSQDPDDLQPIAAAVSEMIDGLSKPAGLPDLQLLVAPADHLPARLRAAKALAPERA